MKIIYLPFFISLSLFTVNVKAEKSYVDICEYREPVIKYIQATKLAQKSLERHIPIGSTFIDLAELNCKNKAHFWGIGFRRKAYESGHFLIRVNMDGTTKMSVVKDG